MTTFGYNRDSGGAQFNTNQAAFTTDFESAWQNIPNYMQSEWHMDYHYPMSIYGTNFGYRPFGMDFVWDQATRSVYSSDIAFSSDVIYFKTPWSDNTPLAFTFDKAGLKADVNQYGLYHHRPDYLHQSGVFIHNAPTYGSFLSLVSSDGTKTFSAIYDESGVMSFSHNGTGTRLDILSSIPLVQFNQPVNLPSNVNMAKITGPLQIVNTSAGTNGSYSWAGGQIHSNATGNVLLSGGNVTATGIFTGKGSGLTNVNASAYTNDFATTGVTDTTTETDIFTQTIPANELGTSGLYKINITGVITNGTGSSSAVRIKVYYGSTVLWNDLSGNLASGAARKTVNMQLAFGAKGSTASQQLGGLIMIDPAILASDPTTGLGPFSHINTLAAMACPYGTAAEDSTSAKVFKVSVTLASASTSLGFNKEIAFMERLR